MISIKNLSFKYHNKVIFDNFNLEIKSNNITTIMGLNGSGKTTLVKILAGLLEYTGDIKIDDIDLNKENAREIRKRIGVVFENPNDQLIKDTIYSELQFVLKNVDLSEEEITIRINEVAQMFQIDNVLHKNYLELNTNQKQLASLAVAIIHSPKVLILDEAFNFMDSFEKEKVLKILKKLKKNMTIIIISHDIEDTLISDNIVVLDKSKIVLKGKKDKIYSKEKVLNDLGFKLPFIVELSNRLMFYGLIDHVIYDMKEMVEVLWK